MLVVNFLVIIFVIVVNICYTSATKFTEWQKAFFTEKKDNLEYIIYELSFCH